MQKRINLLDKSKTFLMLIMGITFILSCKNDTQTNAVEVMEEINISTSDIDSLHIIDSLKHIINSEEATIGHTIYLDSPGVKKPLYASDIN